MVFRRILAVGKLFGILGRSDRSYAHTADYAAVGVVPRIAPIVALGRRIDGHAQVLVFKESGAGEIGVCKRSEHAFHCARCYAVIHYEFVVYPDLRRGQRVVLSLVSEIRHRLKGYLVFARGEVLIFKSVY